MTRTFRRDRLSTGRTERDFRCNGDCCSGLARRRSRRRERAALKAALERDPETAPVRPSRGRP